MTAPPVAPTAKAVEAPAEKHKKAKVTRTNWSKGENLKKMTDAIADWDAELKKNEDERMSLHMFAELHNIPFSTIQMHVTTDDSKRIKHGSGVGTKRIVDQRTTDIIVDVLIRKDRANQGAGVGEALDLLEQMCPESTRPQLDNAFRKTVRPGVKDRLTKPVAAQPTTTKRTAITPQQQWRWHKVNKTIVTGPFFSLLS